MMTKRRFLQRVRQYINDEISLQDFVTKGEEARFYYKFCRIEGMEIGQKSAESYISFIGIPHNIDELNELEAMYDRIGELDAPWHDPKEYEDLIEEDEEIDY